MPGAGARAGWLTAPLLDLVPTMIPSALPTQPAGGWLRPGLAGALAVLGAALAAIATLGPRILDIDDSAWLLHGTLGPDPVTYWLAWQDFAESPWSWPPGRNPDYGLELASAIFYVDAVPIMAFLAKVLRPLVEIPQYWGPWMVLCAALQGFFAWRLLGLAVRDPVARALGALLFAWQPLLLNRMGGHFALVGQWTLLWSLWLCLRSEPRGQTWHWIACLGLLSMINPYILAMCAVLWAADWTARARDGGARAAVAQALAVLASVLGGLWLAGYFTLAGQPEPVGLHYGEAQLDLTAPFDAVEWGRLLPTLPGLRHWEHGGSYLGAGVILLLAAAVFLLPRSRLGPVLRRHAFLIMALVAMLGFAISNRIAIAGHVAVLFDLPEPVANIACMLRSSERFFWPLGYALIFAAVAVLSTRLSTARVRLLLAAALVLQLADIEAGMARFRALVAAAPPIAADRLTDPFWAQAGRRYARVRAVPAGNFGAQWEPVARFAEKWGLATDAVYLSRVDAGAVSRLSARIGADLAVGRWERGTLYVLRNAATRALVARRADPSRDLLTDIDGVTVFAPGWRALGMASGAAQAMGALNY
jgi:hypothetical protein